MKPETQNLTESFIFAESPQLKGKCAICGESVKQTVNKNYEPLQVVLNYKPRTIEIDGGRTFEKISEKYLHVCPKPFTEAQSDSFRGASLGEPALF